MILYIGIGNECRRGITFMDLISDDLMNGLDVSFIFD